MVFKVGDTVESLKPQDEFKKSKVVELVQESFCEVEWFDDDSSTSLYEKRYWRNRY